jgi:methyl-accepting chemotaxis protein
MDWLNSISKKVVSGYALVLIMLLLTTSILTNKLFIIQEVNDEFVDSSLPALKAITQTHNSANAVMMAAYGLYGYTISQQEFADIIDSEMQKFDRSLKQLKAAGINFQAQDSDAFRDALSTLERVMSSEEVDWDLARSTLTQLQMFNDTFATNLKSVEAKVQQQANDTLDEVSMDIDNMILWMVATVVIVIAVTAFAIFMARRTIVEPILSLSSQLDRIVDTKDLTKNVMVQTKDEISIAANSINHLLTAYRSTSNEIRQATSVVIESIDLLNHSGELSKQQIVNLSGSATSLADVVDRLEQSIGDSAERSYSVSEKALTGAQQVETGSSNLSQTSKIISELSADIETSSEMLLSLKHSGDKVSSVVKAIADIAEQTNLLALNAAIEAARAGESGRGFAVVAGEVRTLASRTHDSTYEINSILEEIVTSISTTVESMESNKGKANSAVEAAENTVQSLQELQQTVMALSTENQELAELGQVNQTDAGNMRINIDDVSQSVSSVEETSKETHQASDNLNHLSKSLTEIVGRFKT